MTRIAVAAFVLAASTPMPVDAQYLRDGSVAFRPDARPVPAGVIHAQAKDSTRGDGGTRTVTGVLGFVAGAYVGFTAADRILGPCACDDPGLDALIIGVPIGGIIGSAIGVAAPRLHSPCAIDERLAKAIGGSLAGFAFTLAVAGATGGPGFFTMPVVVPWGGSLAQGRC